MQEHVSDQEILDIVGAEEIGMDALKERFYERRVKFDPMRLFSLRDRGFIDITTRVNFGGTIDLTVKPRSFGG